MKQRIVIAVVPGEPGRKLLDDAPRMLAKGSVVHYLESLIASDGLFFYSHHLDHWSMGDSFKWFLRPKSKVRLLKNGSSEFYVIRRDLLQLRAVPRNDEERLLHALLRSAKSIYRRAAPDAFLFVLREVLDVSTIL